MLQSHITPRSTALAALVVVGLAACGNSSGSGGIPTTPVTAPPSDTSGAPSETTPTPVDVTTIPTPVTTEPPVETDAATSAEMTPELAAFAEANGQLVEDWSTQLSAFGEQAIDLIDDVSAAPAAVTVAELSDELVDAIAPDATDPGLVTLRAFAEGASLAIGYAEAGDQDAALSVFLGLQTQADALTAVLDQFDA